MNSILHNLTTITTLLPNHCRQAFYLKVVKGLPLAVIARRRKCSILRIHLDLATARRHIRKNIHTYRMLVINSPPCLSREPPNYGLRSSVLGLRSSVFNIPSSVSGLRSPVFGLKHFNTLNQNPIMKLPIQYLTLLILTIPFLVPFTLVAQNAATVKGTVTSQPDNEPLAGVNILVKGTTRGVITDANGTFEIEASTDAVLVFSFIGYRSQEMQVSGRSEIAVELIEDAEMLGEVTVYSTGYQQLPEERATGSFEHIDNKLLNRSVSTDVISRLEGVTPSLLFDNRSGESKLSIRGRSTIFANDRPLIIVDNFPYNGDINNINPNDIQDITVLKDAAAASIWGVQAGNGVIVITTKKGSKNQPLRVNFNANVTIGERPDLFYDPRISTSEYIDLEQYLFDQGYYDGDINNTISHPAISPVVEVLLDHRNGDLSEAEAGDQLNEWRQKDVWEDLSEHFYRKRYAQQYALNLSGGSEKHSYYFSTGYDKNLQSHVGNEYERLSLATHQSFRPVDKLEFTTGIYYTQSTGINNNALIPLLSGGGVFPYVSLTGEDGEHLSISKFYRAGFIGQAQDQGLMDWSYTPLDELNYSDNTTDLYDTRLTAGINYELLPGLNAEVKYQYQKQLGDNNTFYDERAYFTRDLINRYSTVTGSGVTRNIPSGAIRDRSSNVLTSYNVRAQLYYNREWAKHELAILGGADIREITVDGSQNRYYGYDQATGLSQSVNYTAYYQQYPAGMWGLIPRIDNISGTTDRFRSWFTNASYSYDSRYTVSASARIDQSNIFGVNANQRSVPLWSAGVKWNVSEELFYNVDALPLLSLRTTYGYNGNLDNTVTAYTTIRYANDALTGRQRADVMSPPNADLRWEKTGMFNLGIDFELKNSVLSGSIEYFHKKGTDLIGESPLDPTTGLTGFRGNVANMVAEGIDLSLTGKIIDKAFMWNSTLMFSYVSDKITEYKQEPPQLIYYFSDASLSGNTFDLTPTEGMPLFGIYSYKWAGLDPDTGAPRGYLNGEPSSDYSNITSAATFDSLYYHGRALPPYFGAWRNDISYKNFSLSVNITYKLGHYFRRPSVNYSQLFTTYYGHSDYTQRWMEPGDEAHTNVPSMVYPSNNSRDNFYRYSEVLVENASHIRLQDIQFTYTLGEKAGPLNQAQVYIYASNLGILWRANDRGLDPDFDVNRSVQSGSIVYPRPAAVSLGFKAHF